METNLVNSNLIEMYLNLINTLNNDSKLEIIARLSQSMKSEAQNYTSFKSLFGAFQSEKTAEQIISEIQQARTFNRQIEKL